VVQDILDVEFSKDIRRHVLPCWKILSELRLFMSRKDGHKNGTASGNGGVPKRGSNEYNIQWLNLELDDEESDYLDKSETTLDYLAASFVSLGESGLNVSIRRVGDGESFCASIIRPSIQSGRSTIGLSGFGSTVRDALLVVMYKFSERCGGDADNFDNQLSATVKRKRFR
jgi:hypothetical protein